MNTETAERLYRSLYAIRAFELKVEEMFANGEIPGFVHLCIGQEACAVGVCAHLETTDYLTSTHRGHGHCIAKGGRLDRMMAELLGRKTGYNGGKGGSMHLADSAIGILGANGINAAGLPLAVGAALSAKLQRNGRVAVAFFGDGASNQGTFHESLNLAAVLDIPVVFVCENNEYAVGSRIRDTTRVPRIVERARGYGIPGRSEDGMNVGSVYHAAGELVERARAGNGPALLELRTWRFRAHFQGEPGTYRSREEEQEWLARDPLEIARREFSGRGLLDASRVRDIENEVDADLAEAVAYARGSPEPEPAEALTDVFVAC